MKRSIAQFYVIVFVCGSASASAAELGTFKANKVCPLLQSKNKGTNPGKLKTKLETSYAVFEANPSMDSPTWLRVRPASGKDLRWVEAGCGTFTAAGERETIEPTEDTSDPDVSRDESSCHAPGTYDSHVLAISWQPGFCHFKASKPECKALPKEPYATSHFTLHGLWPNKNVCGTNYDFCGAVTTEKKDFREFPKIELDKETDASLAQVMPAKEYGSCLERHEWWKHGTCRDTSPNAYFGLAIALLERVNDSEFVSHYLGTQIGALVSRSKFIAAFDKSFGADAHRHVKLQCNSGVLTELQIALPKELDPSKDIGTQLQHAPTVKAGTCPENFWLLEVE